MRETRFLFACQRLTPVYLVRLETPSPTLSNDANWLDEPETAACIEFLLEENKVLREQLDIHAKGKRLRYTAKQKRRLSDAGRNLGRQLLMQFANLVTPETIYAWHRKFVVMKYTPKGRDLSAAKARSAKRDALIIKIATENTGWGYGRIQGMMQHLGYHKISTSTIGEVLRESGIQPSPTRKRGVSWKEFVRIHAEQIAATDFFFVPVWTLRRLAMFRVHFVIDVLTRAFRRLGAAPSSPFGDAHSRFATYSRAR